MPHLAQSRSFHWWASQKALSILRESLNTQLASHSLTHCIHNLASGQPLVSHQILFALVTCHKLIIIVTMYTVIHAACHGLLLANGTFCRILF